MAHSQGQGQGEVAGDAEGEAQDPGAGESAAAAACRGRSAREAMCAEGGQAHGARRAAARRRFQVRPEGWREELLGPTHVSCHNLSYMGRARLPGKCLK